MKINKFLTSGLVLATLNLGAARYECDLCNYSSDDGSYRAEYRSDYDRDGRRGYKNDEIYRNDRGGYSYQGKNVNEDRDYDSDRRYDYDNDNRRSYRRDDQSNYQNRSQDRYQNQGYRNDQNYRVDSNDKPYDYDQSVTGHKDQESADTDHRILMLIQERIKRNPGAKNIRIHVANGQVTILGWVVRDQDRNDIKKDIKNVDGVKGVDDQLQVKESSDSSYKSDKKDPEYQAEKNDPNFKLAEKIKDALKGGFFSTNYDTISFDLNNGVVVLRGTVDSPSAKKDVEDRVKNISEVKRVDNQISVQPKS